MVDYRHLRRTVPAELPKQAVTKVILAVVALLFLVAIVAVLPGIDRVTTGAPSILEAVVTGVLAVAIGAVLVVVAPELGRRATIAVDNPPRFGEDVGSIVHWGIVLAAMVIIHGGLSPIVSRLVGNWIVVFDLLFLIASIPLLMIIAFRLYFCLDPVADRLTSSQDTRETPRDRSQIP